MQLPLTALGCFFMLWLLHHTSPPPLIAVSCQVEHHVTQILGCYNIHTVIAISVVSMNVISQWRSVSLFMPQSISTRTYSRDMTGSQQLCSRMRSSSTVEPVYGHTLNMCPSPVVLPLWGYACVSTKISKQACIQHSQTCLELFVPKIMTI